VKPKVKFGIGVGIILVALLGLAWVSARDSRTYYRTISEYSSLQGAALHQRMRISGDVKAGSIQHLDNETDFVLTEEGKTLAVSYVGSDPLPDTFKDGVQCLVEGHAGSDGHFVAENVQAKCASKYETAPGGNPSGAPAGTGDGAAGSQNSKG
jgi:cytochrome c-type biogenesis protein CcmE